MKVLVVGSSGTIGKAVVELLKSKGHEVVEGSRSTQPVIDITDIDSIENFYATAGQLDAIVCAAGAAAFAPLEKLREEDVQLSVNSKLSGQVNLVRKGLAYLQPRGVFVITGGFLAHSPAPQTSMITMVNLGLEGFAKAAALDLAEGRRIVVVHPPWVAETAAKLGMDATPWPDAADTAQAYVDAIEGNETGVAVFVKGYSLA